MDNLRLSAVADRVVAWHNRHPLARRISAAQVHAIGYVALPFTGEALPQAAPSAAEAAAQAIAAAAATPLPVLTEMAEVAEVAEVAEAAAETQNPAEGSRLRERALARAREHAADPHGTHAADTAAAVLATLAPATLKRAFSEDFIDTLTARQVARFALKHGRVLARAPLDGLVREVRADPGKPDRRQRVPALVYVLTAVIETDTRKSRVLLGNGPLVLGRRIHSGTRMAALAALGAGLVGPPLWWLQAQTPVPQNMEAPAAAAAAAGSAAAAATSADTAGIGGIAGIAGIVGTDATATMAAAAAAASAAASAALPAAAAATPAETSASAALPTATAARNVPMIEPPSAPVPQPEQRRRKVSIVPLLSDEQKALAREQREALMGAAAAALPPVPPVPTVPPASVPAVAAPVRAEAGLPKPLPAPPATTAAVSVPAATPGATPGATPAATAAPAPTRPMAAAPPTGPVFAISTRALRTRAEADQVRVAMQALLQTLGHARMQVDVLPQGEDWRVVALPFAQRADAEKGRALLASRGMRVAVVDF